MNQKRVWTLLLSALMLGAVFVPLVSAMNDTTPTPLGWVGPFYQLAEPRDMSAYNPVITPVPVRRMNDETVKAYPGLKIISPDIRFPVGNNSVDVQKSTMKAAKINFVKPASKNGSMAKAVGAPMVIPEYGYFNWQWTQDSIVTQTIVIHNYGDTTASGQVTFVSIEEMTGTSAPFTNLAPGENCTVSIPFVVSGVGSVGIKPMGFFITVDPDNAMTWAGQLSLNAIEKYNNDASHLPDPDSGDNLETSDLYHFPFSEGYAIIEEAATAADNTVVPYDTGKKLNEYVSGKMKYIKTNTTLEYALSDLTVKNLGYEGVCDEYATMDIAFSRSLGIPSRFLYVTWINETGFPEYHALLEHGIGSSWIHSDPTWNSYDNPQAYKQANNTHLVFTKFTDADDDLFTEDPAGDGMLTYADMIAVPLGELPAYN
jgi:hypothetical protein